VSPSFRPIATVARNQVRNLISVLTKEITLREDEDVLLAVFCLILSNLVNVFKIKVVFDFRSTSTFEFAKG